MSDEHNTPAADPAIESKARAMGWAPRENFRGDPEKFIDAKTFVENGERVLPIVRKANADLQARVAVRDGEIGMLKQSLKEMADSIEELKKFHTTDKRRAVEAERARLVQELKQAKKDGDTDAEVDLQQAINKADVALATPDPEPPKKAAPATQPADGVDPAYIAWVQSSGNTWLGKDQRKTALAMAIAKELREDPANNSLIGVAFYERVAEEVEAMLGEKREGKEPPASKVGESGGGRGGSGGSGTRARGYNDLPADAKAACASYEDKLVGPGKAYKDVASWRAYYATEFFSQE